MKSYLSIGPAVLAVLLLYGLGEKGAPQAIRVPEDKETVAAAIAAASAGDTIVLSAGRFTGDVTIEKPVTIVGRGQRRTTITGNDDVLTVKADLTLRDLTIAGGANCVFVGPGNRLTMTQCTVAGLQRSARQESAKQIRLQTTIYNEGATRCLEMTPRNNSLIRNWYAD